MEFEVRTAKGEYRGVTQPQKIEPWGEFRFAAKIAEAFHVPFDGKQVRLASFPVCLQHGKTSDEAETKSGSQFQEWARTQGQ